MTPEEQHALVLEQLARREEIAAQTRQHMAERDTREELDPMASVDPAIRLAAEDEWYAARGKRRYRTSDGRTMFLTPEENAQRRRGRSGGKPRPRSSAYGPGTDSRNRQLVTWGFNIGDVVLALVIVAVILS